MKKSKVTKSLSDSKIPYKLESVTYPEKSFSLTIYCLPDYHAKEPSNDVIDLSKGNLLGFMPSLAIGMGTGRLALPAVCPSEPISIRFTGDYMEEMTPLDIESLHERISNTLDILTENFTKNIKYLDTI